MSLINQMLDNLESRRQRKKTSEIPILEGLEASAAQKKNWIALYRPWAAIALVIILLLVFIFWPMPHINRQPQTKPAAAKVMPVLPVTPAATQMPVQQNVNAQNLAQPQVATSSTVIPGTFAHIQALGVTGDQTNTRLSVYLNKNAPYAVTTEPTQNTLTLTLTNAQLSEPLLPINTQNTSIQDIKVTNINNQTKIVLTLIAGTQLLNLQENAQNPNAPQIILDLMNNTQQPVADVKAISSIVNNGTAITTPPLNGVALDDSTEGNPNAHIEKTPTPVTAEQMADEKYQKAIDLLQENHSVEAIDILKNLLAQMPSYYPARETLITVLLQEKRFEEAAPFVHEGLRLQPHYPPLTKLAAEMYVGENQFENAIDILETATPSMGDAPDYYAFMAALYKELDQPAKSAKIYSQLVQSFPNNSLWWLGLGSSYEMLRKSKEAREAYQNASSSGNLTPELQSFVDSRISKLGG